jgi:tRNA dimethylallyltransferase
MRQSAIGAFDPRRSPMDRLPPIDSTTPILIAGPTASGKSALALDIAERFGGTIVNADASQVYDCWRIVTARPTAQEEARAPHRLYGHVAWNAPYSAGHWLRDVAPLLSKPDRPIIIGGTGLYFLALTQGLTALPETDPAVRTEADALGLQEMADALDDATRARLDLQNRARVQRAWEVQRQTGRGMAHWQDATPPPILPPAQAIPILVTAPKPWLEARIFRRFDKMIAEGALDEVSAMRDRYDPALPAFRAIGVPELIDVVNGISNLTAARDRAAIATRQFAKRQRTWFRARMRDWHPFDPS